MPPEAPDPLAEHELCRELVPRVRAFALRRTRDAALAADVAQEVALITIDALRRGRVDEPWNLVALCDRCHLALVPRPS